MQDIKQTIFRAYDIRGIYEKDIDPIVFYKIGLSAGTYIKENLKGSRLTVGNDIRKSSETLAYAFISGVAATGVEVIYTGTSSFGQTLFHGWQHQQDLISFITASHLPAEWNGVKFYYGDGVGLPEEELMKIRDIVLNEQWKPCSWDKTGNIKKEDPSQAYKDFLKSHFSYQKPIRVAVDCGGGSMTLSAPDVFNHVGLETIPVFCEPDPLFSKRPSDPKPKNLTQLVDTIKKEKCDFGVAFDGDGDRAVIVDNTGTILSADETGIILGKLGLKEKKGTVIVNVECSKAVEEQLTPMGLSVKQIQVGHTYLTLHAKQEESPLGIESSGHLILPAYYLFDDALIIPLKIAEILDQSSQNLESLRSDIPIYPRNKVEIPCSDETKFDVIDQLKNSLKDQYTDINTLDGVRVTDNQGWALIRASNTSPIIRLTVEADTEDIVAQLTEKFQKKTEEIIQKTQQ